MNDLSIKNEYIGQNRRQLERKALIFRAKNPENEQNIQNCIEEIPLDEGHGFSRAVNCSLMRASAREVRLSSIREFFRSLFVNRRDRLFAIQAEALFQAINKATSSKNKLR